MAIRRWPTWQSNTIHIVVPSAESDFLMHPYSNTVYEQYVQNIMEIEKGLVELRLQLDVANGKDKKILKAKIKEAEESVEAMKIARKSMLKFQSAFETGLAVE